MKDLFSGLNLSSFYNKIFITPNDAFYQTKAIDRNNSSNCDYIQSDSLRSDEITESSSFSYELPDNNIYDIKKRSQKVIPFTSFLKSNWSKRAKVLINKQAKYYLQRANNINYY